MWSTFLLQWSIRSRALSNGVGAHQWNRGVGRRCMHHLEMPLEPQPPTPQYGCFPRTLPFAVQHLVIPSAPAGTHTAPTMPSIWPGSRSAPLRREIGHVTETKTPGGNQDSQWNYPWNVSTANGKPSATHKNGSSPDHIPLNGTPPTQFCHMLTWNIKVLAAHTE